MILRITRVCVQDFWLRHALDMITRRAVDDGTEDSSLQTTRTPTSAIGRPADSRFTFGGIRTRKERL